MNEKYLIGFNHTIFYEDGKVFDTLKGEFITPSFGNIKLFSSRTGATVTLPYVETIQSLFPDFKPKSKSKAKKNEPNT